MPKETEHRNADPTPPAEVPPTDPSRVAKGDLPTAPPELGRGLTDSGLSHTGKPFKNLRGS